MMVPVSHRDRAFRPKTDRCRRNRRRLSKWLTSAQGLRLGVAMALFGKEDWRPALASTSRTTAARPVHVLDDRLRRLPGCLPSKPFAEEVDGGASCILAGQVHAPASVGGTSAMGRGNRRVLYNRARRSMDFISRARNDRPISRGFIDLNSQVKGPGVHRASALTRRVKYTSLSRYKRPPLMVQNDRASIESMRHPCRDDDATFFRRSRSPPLTCFTRFADRGNGVTPGHSWRGRPRTVRAQLSRPKA